METVVNWSENALDLLSIYLPLYAIIMHLPAIIIEVNYVEKWN